MSSAASRMQHHAAPPCPKCAPNHPKPPTMRSTIVSLRLRVLHFPVSSYTTLPYANSHLTSSPSVDCQELADCVLSGGSVLRLIKPRNVVHA